MPDMPPTAEPLREGEGPEPPPLGEKTASAILALLQDFYRQELGAEEDVHRTLPFFATALGLIVAALNYSATQLPSWSAVINSCYPFGSSAWWQIVSCAWSVLLAGTFLLVVVGLSGAVLWHLGRATRKREYERVGPERLILTRTRELHMYYAGMGIVGENLDEAVVIDVRAQLLDSFCEVVPVNREITLQRYKHRARAVSCLLWSLVFALLDTTLIIATTKFGVIEAWP